MKNKGFTLIELLVVISIISLLSSVVLVSIQDAREKAIQTKFDQEFLGLRTAIELARADNRGEYPSYIQTSGTGGADIIYYLWRGGYLTEKTIETPTGWSLGDVHPTTMITCGSPGPSSNKYALYVTSPGDVSSNIPKMYYYNDGYVEYYGEESGYYRCIEF